MDPRTRYDFEISFFLGKIRLFYSLELALPEEVDPEAPLRRHPDDCKVYYNFNFPMTCGEGFAFHSEKLACVPEEEADC